MKRQTPDFKVSALSLGVSLFSAICVGEARAQDVGLEEVVVTGSRIAQDSATASASPVTVLDGSNIRSSGQSDLGELLRESPALNNSLPSNFSVIPGDEGDAGTDDSDVGLGLLDLRGLGAVRTLVLVNGRRHVAGAQGSAAVDVNAIPTVMVKRVETLTGGASSIYGADAVSGVVNFILRDGGDFDGAEFTIQSGISSRWDADETYMSFGTGFEFADGRGEMVLAIEGLTQSEVLESDRLEFAGPNRANDINNNPTLAALTGVNPDATRAFVAPTTNPISSPYGVFNVASQDAFFDSVIPAVNGVRDGTGVPMIEGTNIPVAQVITQPFTGMPRPYNPGIPSNVNQSFGPSDGLQSVRQTILPEQDRWNINLNGSFALTDGLSVFLESKYTYSKNSQVQGVDFNDGIPIAYDNPYIPAGLAAQITELQGLGVIGPNPNDGSFYGFGSSRDPDDAVVMPADEVERETVRIVAGIEGEFDFAGGVSYELSLNYGRTDVETNNINLRLEDRFYAALDSTVDPDTGDIVCRSSLDPSALPPIGAGAFPVPVFTENAFTPFGRFTEFVSFTPGPDSGCVPFNPFGLNSSTQAYADFVYVDAMDQSELEQRVVLGTLAGDTSSFFELPGGAIGWAAGFEYREEDSAFIVNEFEGTGNTWDGSNGNAVEGLEGGFDVFEYFIEAQAPLLADLPGVEFLEVTGAIRFADYSTVGKNEAWSTGLRWSPGFGLTLRGTVAEAVRAPNVAELFGPQQPVFFAFQDDPCSIANINLGSPNRASNCAQFVPDGYDVNDFITAGIPGVSGGNPELEAEEATTFTAGIVYEPTFVEGLRFIVDYYETEIEGAIAALEPERVAEACVDLPSTANQFCPLIERAPQGFITFHQSGQVNLGAFEVAGVDFGADYALGLEDIGLDDLGMVSFGITGTHLIEFNEFQDPIDTSVFEDRVGEFGYPEWILNANVNWMIGAVTLSWNGRYEDSQLLTGLFNQQFASNPLFADPATTGDSWVHDFNFNVDVSDNLSVYGGLNNAFDQQPYLGSLARPAGPRGRFGFLALNYRL